MTPRCATKEAASIQGLLAGRITDDTDKAAAWTYVPCSGSECAHWQDDVAYADDRGSCSLGSGGQVFKDPAGGGK